MLNVKSCVVQYQYLIVLIPTNRCDVIPISYHIDVEQHPTLNIKWTFRGTLLLSLPFTV